MTTTRWKTKGETMFGKSGEQVPETQFRLFTTVIEDGVPRTDIQTQIQQWLAAEQRQGKRVEILIDTAIMAGSQNWPKDFALPVFFRVH